MAKYKVSKKLRDIIIINQSIIDNLKAQKARSDKTLDKYKGIILEEIDLPSNKFLNWTRAMDPFLDSVISSKVTDYELLKRYEHFVKELVAYEQQQIITEGAVEDMGDNVENSINVIIKLEQKFEELRKRAIQSINSLRLRYIDRYQNQPKNMKFNDNTHCILCGDFLSRDEIGNTSECFECSRIPEHLKSQYYEDENVFKSEQETEETVDNDDKEDIDIQESETIDESVEEDTETYTKEKTNQDISETENSEKDQEDTPQKNKSPKKSKFATDVSDKEKIMAEFLQAYNKKYIRTKDGRLRYRGKQGGETPEGALIHNED